MEVVLDIPWLDIHKPVLIFLGVYILPGSGENEQ